MPEANIRLDIRIDTKRFVEAINRVAEAFLVFRDTILTTIGSFSQLNSKITFNNLKLFYGYNEDYVVDVMGISRIDIREIKIDDVWLWNHRHLPIDIFDVVEYAKTRIGSRRP